MNQLFKFKVMGTAGPHPRLEGETRFTQEQKNKGETRKAAADGEFESEVGAEPVSGGGGDRDTGGKDPANEGGVAAVPPVMRTRPH